MGRGGGALFAILCAVSASCGSGSPPGSYERIVLVTIDTLRADRVGAYGAERPLTPHIDALADAMKDEDAYAMAKTMYENWKQMQKDYPPLRGTKLSALVPANNPIPYHPGAAKYWKEVGVWKPANEKQDAGRR